MITMKAKYALKALCRLALTRSDEPMLIADIAQQEGIPRKFLELILGELKQHGILQSRKGRGGGYSLAKNPDTITVASVLRVLDGPIAPVPCLSRTAYQRCAECPDEPACGVRLILRDAYAASVHVLENTTLADMAARVEAAAQANSPATPLKYSI
jgi:Rrf2 family protein